MSATQIDAQPARKPLRIWPGAIIAALVVLFRFIVPVVAPDWLLFGFIAGVAGFIAIVVWWLFFSRAPWVERFGAIAVMIIAAFVVRLFLHKSIVGGMMGMMPFIYAFPAVIGPAFVAWAVATRRLSDGVRRASMVAAIFLACGVWTLFRTDGITGGAGAQIAWRWTKTPEERLLAQQNDEPAAPAPEPAKAEPTPMVTEAPKEPVAASASATPARKTEPASVKTEPIARPAVMKRAEWPGFRGPDRDGVIRDARIDTDWAQSPPVAMWRRPVGPGWSSFAVNGDLLYTQEQRGEDEIVSCYRVSTGKPVWRHKDSVRFWESNGGAGPRATPTLNNGRVYTFGATGILNALDAVNGALLWSRNVSSDSGRKVPMWGFASSPLVVDGVVIVAASGTMVGYDAETGNKRWSGPVGGGSYSSPHLVTIDGVEQILLLSGAGATSVAPANGRLLWEYRWPADITIVQPTVLADGDVLITTAVSSGGVGIRRLGIGHQSGKWTVEERWTSNGLKPYFNDYVVHNGHAYGFDGNILSCIDLKDGTRRWKGGRYGSGQLVLLDKQDLLLVISEEGELALVKAVPDQFTEVARVPALEGKTWNHPVIVHDVLLVRNDHEMAAFRLPPGR